MNKKLVAALLAAVSLGAGAQGNADRQPIDVRVVDGQIVVPEEEAVTTRDQGGLVWRLVTPGYRFPADGIVIDSQGKHRCQVIANGQRFRCAKLRHDSGERYKYMVNVETLRGERLPELDPWIVND